MATLNEKMIELARNVVKIGTPRTGWIEEEIAMRKNYELAISILTEVNKKEKNKIDRSTWQSGENINGKFVPKRIIYHPVYTIVSGDETKAVKTMNSYDGITSTCDFGDVKMKIWKVLGCAEKALGFIKELWDKENYHIKVIVDPNNPDSYEVVKG